MTAKTLWWINLNDGEGYGIYESESEALETASQLLNEARTEARDLGEWADDVVENSWSMGTMTVTHRVERTVRPGRDPAHAGWRFEDVDYAWSPVGHVVVDLEGTRVAREMGIVWCPTCDEAVVGGAVGQPCEVCGSPLRMVTAVQAVQGTSVDGQLAALGIAMALGNVDAMDLLLEQLASDPASRRRLAESFAEGMMAMRQQHSSVEAHIQQVAMAGGIVLPDISSPEHNPEAMVPSTVANHDAIARLLDRIVHRWPTCGYVEADVREEARKIIRYEVEQWLEPSKE